MRLFNKVLTVGVVTLSLSSCGTNNNPSSNDTNDKVKVETESSTELKAAYDNLPKSYVVRYNADSSSMSSNQVSHRSYKDVLDEEDINDYISKYDDESVESYPQSFGGVENCVKACDYHANNVYQGDNSVYQGNQPVKGGVYQGTKGGDTVYQGTKGGNTVYQGTKGGNTVYQGTKGGNTVYQGTSKVSLRTSRYHRPTRYNPARYRGPVRHRGYRNYSNLLPRHTNINISTTIVNNYYMNNYRPTYYGNSNRNWEYSAPRRIVRDGFCYMIYSLLPYASY